MLHRCKKCGDILKVASVGGGELANLKACHFSLKTIVQKGVCPILKRWHINRVMGQNVQRLLIWLFAQLVSLRTKSVDVKIRNKHRIILFFFTKYEKPSLLYFCAINLRNYISCTASVDTVKLFSYEIFLCPLRVLHVLANH